jgi:hypothetical protein
MDSSNDVNSMNDEALRVVQGSPELRAYACWAMLTRWRFDHAKLETVE